MSSLKIYHLVYGVSLSDTSSPGAARNKFIQILQLGLVLGTKLKRTYLCAKLETACLSSAAKSARS